MTNSGLGTAQWTLIKTDHPGVSPMRKRFSSRTRSLTKSTQYPKPGRECLIPANIIILPIKRIGSRVILMILGIMNHKNQKGKGFLFAVLVLVKFLTILDLVTKNSILINRKTLVLTASLTDTTLKVQSIVVNHNLGKDPHRLMKLRYQLRYKRKIIITY